MRAGCLALGWLGCAGAPDAPEWTPSFGELPDVGEQVVRDPFVGVRMVSREVTVPRPLSAHFVLVDPQAPGVSFTGTPGNGAAPLETVRQTGSEFLADVGAAVAINAHFFAPWPASPEEPAELVGWALSDGEEVSPFDDGEVGFGITADGQAAVVLPPDDRSVYDDGVGAFEQIVTDGRNTATWEELHPRTAIGVTGDGVVVLAVVDGRQEGVSEGVTTPELADWLLDFGVTGAINLDGGGSTTLVERARDGRPALVNVPVGYVLPGTERHCGSFFGVRARDRE